MEVVVSFDEIKADLVRQIKRKKVDVSRQFFLELIFANHQAYELGKYSYSYMKKLDDSIKSIWEDTFNVKLGSIVSKF